MYKLKYNFSSISNGTEAYILGFIYADGYVIINEKLHRMGITLAKKDEKHLIKILRYISDDVPMKYESRRGFHNCRINISQKEFVNNLRKLGVEPNKTGIDFGMPNIPEEFIFDFIRGYFDGDGSIISDRKYIKFFICSPLPKILEEMKSIFKENEVACYLRKDKRKGKIGNYGINNYDQYRLMVDKTVYQQKLYKLLYDNADLYLERKERKFRTCFINNERKSRDEEFIEFNGKVQSLKEWSKELNINIKLLRYRIFKEGWDIEKALNNRQWGYKELQKEKTPKGENHPRACFSNEDVIKIFLSTESNRYLSKLYNVHRDTIYKIKAGINYSIVTKDIKR